MIKYRIKFASTCTSEFHNCIIPHLLVIIQGKYKYMLKTEAFRTGTIWMCVIRKNPRGTVYLILANFEVYSTYTCILKWLHLWVCTNRFSVDTGNRMATPPIGIPRPMLRGPPPPHSPYNSPGPRQSPHGGPFGPPHGSPYGPPPPGSYPPPHSSPGGPRYGTVKYGDKPFWSYYM